MFNDSGKGFVSIFAFLMFGHFLICAISYLVYAFIVYKEGFYFWLNFAGSFCGLYIALLFLKEAIVIFKGLN